MQNLINSREWPPPKHSEHMRGVRKKKLTFLKKHFGSFFFFFLLGSLLSVRLLHLAFLLPLPSRLFPPSHFFSSPSLLGVNSLFPSKGMGGCGARK